MSIFSFFRKSNASAHPSPASRQTDTRDAITFYKDCVQDFHETAKDHGVATRGVTFIPELIPIGEKTILAFLKDPYFQMQFSGNPQGYYYLIMSLSLEAGIVFGAQWHENVSDLKNGFVEHIIEVGPADSANQILQAKFSQNISANQGNCFFQKIFTRWMAMHEPYWKLRDPRDYTFNAMLAAYQLGISMILEKCGY